MPFTVHAVVTNSDLEFSTTSIDFGCATIYESVKHTVTLTNQSILPQQFGFVGIPEVSSLICSTCTFLCPRSDCNDPPPFFWQYVDVQPNDGFGTLLPLETIDLDIIYQPKKAQEVTFDLTCKSLINRLALPGCHEPWPIVSRSEVWFSVLQSL